MNKILAIMVFIAMASACKADKNSSILEYTDEEINKVNMENCTEKLNYLKNKLTLNTKYSYYENKEFFNHIFVGKWHNPPHTVYELKMNSSLKFKNFDTSESASGYWSLTENGIKLKTGNTWIEKKVLYFRLIKGNKENVFYFNIKFDDPMFFLTIDSQIANLWDVNFPLK